MSKYKVFVLVIQYKASFEKVGKPLIIAALYKINYSISLVRHRVGTNNLKYLLIIIFLR